MKKNSKSKAKLLPRERIKTQRQELLSQARYVSLKTLGLILTVIMLWTGEMAIEQTLGRVKRIFAVTHVATATEEKSHSVKKRLKLCETSLKPTKAN